MKTYLILFWIFAKIGTFTLGGGYAMLPLIERELVDKGRYLDEQEFLDATAVAQAAPGTAAMHHWYLFSIWSRYLRMVG